MMNRRRRHLKHLEYFKNLAESVQFCYGCSQCISFCPFYPSVFSLLESFPSDPAAKIADNVGNVLNLCYDCRLCSTGCPFGKDVPHQVILAKGEYFKRNGIPLIQRIFGNIERFQNFARLVAPVLNFVLSGRLFRIVLEKIVGIHRERILPKIYRQSFLSWSRRRKRRAIRTSSRKVVYFYGCFTNTHRPEEGMAAVEILERNGIQVEVPEWNCCGLPQYSEGDPEAIMLFRKNLVNLASWVKKGYDVLVTSVPCGLTLREEYPLRLESAEAALVANHVFDISEYLLKLLREGSLALPEHPVNGRVAYHVPCHLKAMEIGFPSYELLKKVPGLEVKMVDQGCCGLAGTMGFHKEGFALAQQIGKPMIEGIRNTGATMAVSDCPKCNLQIKQGTGIEAVHPLEIFYKSYTG